MGINHNTHTKGFTLVELVLVLGILGILLPAVFSLFVANLRAQTKVLILQDVKRNGDTALDTIEILVKAKAKSIEQQDGTPVCTTSGSTYSGDLYFVDDAGNRFMFNQSNNRIASESAATDYLTTNKVSVSSFEMSCDRSSLFVAPLISISFTIDQAQTTSRAEESASLQYQTKIRLRNL